MLELILTLIVYCSYGQTSTMRDKQQAAVGIKSDSLAPVIVSATIRPHIKGDTVEFNTEHFLLRRNTAVEEMLKQLPGLQIDGEGNITYNGEKIHRLLVDGQDIFSSDPKLITRNFEGSKVARVQILDRKSDKAGFTGVDDGLRTKTLNLVMKESARHGCFGKVEGGGNLERNYNADGMFAALSENKQFMAFGLASNTGNLGLNGGAGGGGGITFSNWSQDILGTSAGPGVPRFLSTAVHYGDAGIKPADIVGVNYQYGILYTEPVMTSRSLQQVPGSVFQRFQSNRSQNQQVQHWVYGTYGFTAGKASAFKMTFYGIQVAASNEFLGNEANSFNDTAVSHSLRTITDNLHRQNVGADLLWRIQVGKSADRVFSVNTAAQRGNEVNVGNIYSVNRYYQPNGLAQSADTTDQRKLISAAPVKASFSLTFAEPLWAGIILGMSGGLSFANDKPTQSTFSRGDGKYQDIIDSLSSRLITRSVKQSMSAGFQGKFRRLSFIAGGTFYSFHYYQNSLLVDSLLHISYFELTPQLMIGYHFNSTSGLNFRFGTALQEPSPEQLQAVKNNSDPFHITIGNPNLHAGSSQNFRLDVYKYKRWLINLTVNGIVISNSISTQTITDALGRQVSEPLNVAGGGMAGFSFSVARRILGFDFGMHGQGDWSQSVNYVNIELNRNTSNSAGGGLSFGKYDANIYSLQLNSNFTWFGQRSSVNLGEPIQYWSQSHQGAITLFFIRDFEINTNAVCTWQQKTNSFAENTSVLLWNAYLSHNFIHDRLVVKLQLNNILNSNSSITRTNTTNTNTETSTNILGRYWMLSAGYHFDKKFKRK